MAQNFPMMVSDGEISPISLNFTSIPDLGGNDVSSYGANLNVGLPLKKNFIGLSLGYQNFDFTFGESTNRIDLSAFENIQVFRTGLSFIRPLNGSLRFLISGGAAIMSNLDGDLSSNDLVFNAIIGAIKSWGDDSRKSSLLIGAFYGTQLGEPTLLPAISFRQRLNDRWSYSLGIPVTGITYNMGQRHRLALQASPQGIFANNSSLARVEGNRTITNTKLQFNGITTRLFYQYRFAKNLALFAEGGFMPSATLKVLDDDNNDIIDLGAGSGAFFNVGLRLVVQRPKKGVNEESSNDSSHSFINDQDVLNNNK